MILTSFIIVLTLIMARVIGFFMLVPIFGSKNISVSVRIIFIVFISLIIYPVVSVDLDTLPTGNDAYVLGILFEIINGVCVGAIVIFVTNAIYVAGHLIDMNMGFAMVNVFSAQSNSEIPITANLYYIFSMIIFITLNFHHKILEAIIYTFKVAPLGKLGFNVLMLNKFIQVFSESFMIGFQIASPMILTILITNVLLGILAKAMPGMNVFVIGMPVKIVIGLMVLLITAPFILGMLQNIYVMMFEYMGNIIRLMEG